MEQKGSMLLKVASIIMMVGGIISAVVTFILAIFAAVGQAVVSSEEGQIALASQGISTQTSGSVMALVWVGVAILVAGAVFEIVAGVKGKANWNNPAQAQTLMIFGIICAALGLIGNIFFSVGMNSAQIISILSGLVVPVLYIIGTVQLKNQA